ncbi:hypothetical protein Q8A67_019680 [Cirrhinus molitorella]|uniref:Ig-like domain-containing protein n=1 Tax=Cirrhinus molitorella TaxID=172907 RepID=A0AA88TDW5_9TELE|nr:hypothetical protein Q8A67_019680 [Cirrhinus molitorella]
MGKVIFCYLLTVAGLKHKYKYFSLLISVGLVVVLAHQGNIQLGSSVTLPCQDSHHKNIQSDLLDIQWWTGEHMVTRFKLGRIIQGCRYINRTYLSAEGLRNGDFSLSITHTEYRDSGRYRCVLTKEGEEVTLGEVDLESLELKVLCLLSQDRRLFCLVLAMLIGQAQRLHLFSGRDGLRWCLSGNMALCLIVHGDISLIFNDTLPDDDGYYVCFFKKNGDIRPSTIINLTITEQMSRVNRTSGSQLQLPVPNESRVTLSFLPDGGNYTVSVCELDRRHLTCVRHYHNRTLLQDNTLILRNLTSADSGTFFVREKGTRRTRNVVVLQIFIDGMFKNEWQYLDSL